MIEQGGVWDRESDGSKGAKSGRSLSRFSINGLRAGVIMAIVAVFASVLIDGSGNNDPGNKAYGICMACHGRDLLNWLLNHGFGFQLPVAPAFVIFPALTTVGVLVGAHIAAISRGEFRWHCSQAPVISFVLGMLVMNFALLAGGCATRIFLRVATGDQLGITGFIAMLPGIILATYLLRWWAQR